MFLSIVIPAYNEEARLGKSLQKIAEFLASKSYKSEVIAVDDGSKDRTAEIAREHTAAYERLGIALRVLQNPGNQGKGYSVRNGMLNARGEVALFTDADLSSPIEEADRLIAPIIADQYDVVFGSRALTDSVIAVHQSHMREMAGRTFNFVMRTVTGLNYKDTQCGFKAYNLRRTRAVFEQQRIKGFGFDAEILYIAKRHGLRLLEMPVLWGHAEGSKVDLLSGMIPFIDLLAVRWNDVCGRYIPQTAPAESGEAINREGREALTKLTK